LRHNSKKESTAINHDFDGSAVLRGKKYQTIRGSEAIKLCRRKVSGISGAEKQLFHVLTKCVSAKSRVHAGLPDFSKRNIPKRGKINQITKWV
jgi:hypothetical protein